MKKIRGGFTLIEVMLFLAITGLLFLGVTIGVQNSVFQQRYNDSVQSFVDFLKSEYAETMNVQGKSSQGGNTEYAIYGRLLAFGEARTPNGEENVDGDVFAYTVIGGANNEVGTTNVLDALQRAKADVLSGDGRFAGIVESFSPKWGSRIESTISENNRYVDFSGLILIIRHPGSGTVYTYVMDNNTVQINSNYAGKKNGDLLSPHLNGDNFKIEQVDFCINPTPSDIVDYKNTNRVDVRINRGARNYSAI